LQQLYVYNAILGARLKIQTNQNVNKAYTLYESNMATKRKSTKTTRKDLESKIAELESKLSKLSSQLESKPAPKAEAPKPEAKPAEAPKPEAKPAEAPKPEAKPAEAPKPEAKPAEVPKPAAEEKAAPPATIAEAMEAAVQNYPMTSFHDYRAKVTGYSPAPNRYFGRITAPVGQTVHTNWNLQKAAVTGYTANSDQYYATRQRMAYHPADKMFVGYGLTVEGVEVQTQQAPPPPQPESAQQAPPPQQTTASSGGSKKSQLDTYESEYMERLEREAREAQELMAAASELAAKKQAESKPSSSGSTKGSLPKGF